MSSNSSRTVIVAAIDASETTADVLRTSALLGRILAGTELHLLHVIEPALDTNAHNALLTSLDQLVASARCQMDDAAARARELFSGRVIPHLTVGTPWIAILQLATDMRADLVVVGSHRKGRIERWLLGSVSDQVVRKAPCAVLVARPKEATAVPEIEPPCPDCLAVQGQSAGSTLPCNRHERKHARARIHYELPSSFAVGSMLLRPED